MSELLDDLTMLMFDCDECGNTVVKTDDFEQEHICGNPCPSVRSSADLPEWLNPQPGDLDYGV
jgi:endogenous inhibitor of DNA gyrase (YacG/DUF329 family)